MEFTESTESHGTIVDLIFQIVWDTIQTFFLENYMIKFKFQTVASTDCVQTGMEREDTKGKSTGTSGKNDEISKTMRIDS